MNIPIVYPTTAEKFAAYQEQGLGRALTPLERSLIVVWLPTINDAYLIGIDGESIREDIEHMAELISRYAVNATLYRFLQSVLLWMCRAWVRGFNEYKCRKELEGNDAV